MPELVAHWAGYLGVALYLSSYALLQSGVLRGSGYTYTLMNLAAAFLVLVSLSQDFNLSSALIQTSWIIVSLIGLAKRVFLQHSVTMTAEEAALSRNAFPSFSRVQARRILDLGHWVNLAPGTLLTTEGAPVRTLNYMLSGEAKVICAGQEIATINSGFIGEINVLSEGAATATVCVSQPSRAFLVSARALKSVVQFDYEQHSFLVSDLRNDTGRKLQSLNADLSKSYPNT